jgi:hypothetical protein
VIESSAACRRSSENSDYASLSEAKAAVDRYFADGNEHFGKQPTRAGEKIWGADAYHRPLGKGRIVSRPEGTGDAGS